MQLSAGPQLLPHICGAIPCQTSLCLGSFTQVNSPSAILVFLVLLASVRRRKAGRSRHGFSVLPHICGATESTPAPNRAGAFSLRNNFSFTSPLRGGGIYERREYMSEGFHIKQVKPLLKFLPFEGRYTRRGPRKKFVSPFFY